MEYVKNVKVTETILVDAHNLENIQPGDHLSNCVFSGDDVEVIYDGGLNFRDAVGIAHNRVLIKRYQKAGKFLIRSDKGLYRYVTRSTTKEPKPC